jgi:hypothetical protein
MGFVFTAVRAKTFCTYVQKYDILPVEMNSSLVEME